MSVSISVIQLTISAKPSYRRNTACQILYLDSCSSISEFNVTKTINLNAVIYEYAFVKPRKDTS